MLNKNKYKNELAFTLIELLVVISVIGLLSSIILVSLVSVRQKARDASRLQDLSQVRNALEVYFLQKGHYPISFCAGGPGDGFIMTDGSLYRGFGVCNTYGGSQVGSFNNELSAYMSPLTDPRPNPSVPSSGYWYSSNGEEYVFQIFGTPENMNNFPEQYRDIAVCGLPITNDGNCGSAGTQNSPAGGNYWANGVAIWTSGIHKVHNYYP